MFEAFFVALSSVWADSGFSALTGGHVIMICVGLLLLYMAIAKGFEPLLLSPIAFGCILANIPKTVSKNLVLCPLSCTVFTTKYSRR